MTRSADYYEDGAWNAFCDFCGAKQKSGNMMRTWNNFYVCRHHKEVRNPQDFVRGVKENMSLPWTRPEPADTFKSYTCTLRGRNAIPFYAIPGCATPGYVNLAFAATGQVLPTRPYACDIQGNNAISGFATPGCIIPGFVDLGFIPRTQKEVK